MVGLVPEALKAPMISSVEIQLNVEDAKKKTSAEMHGRDNCLSATSRLAGNGRSTLTDLLA